MNYVLSLSFTGNTGLVERLQHATDGSVSIRSDQAAYEDLFSELNLQRHLFKANFVWDLPKLPPSNGAAKAIGYVINDWQLSGLFTGGSGNRYDLGFSYVSNGRQREPHGLAGLRRAHRLHRRPGQGLLEQPVRAVQRQRGDGTAATTASASSPAATCMVGCPDHTLDLAIARNIRLGGARNFQIRLDAFNVFNSYIINGRNTTVQFTQPDRPDRAQSAVQPRTARWSANRLTPRNAGFGAATGAQNRGPDGGFGGNYNRTIQLAFRFQF